MTSVATTSTVALEDFIQAVQLQLDNAQARMTLKAQNDSLPLTFAIKDISMDLKAHVEMQRGEVRIKPAGPADTDASVLHLVFTAITRPMIDENATQLAIDDDEDPAIDSLGDALDEEERRRLEMIGVRTVSKLHEIQRRGLERSVGRLANMPVDRIRSALARASRPMVDDVAGDVANTGADEIRTRLKVRGRNLMRNGQPPQVTIDGAPVSVVQASDTEITLAPRQGQFAGQMSLSHDQKEPVHVWFDQSGWDRETVQ